MLRPSDPPLKLSEPLVFPKPHVAVRVSQSRRRPSAIAWVQHPSHLAAFCIRRFGFSSGSAASEFRHAPPWVFTDVDIPPPIDAKIMRSVQRVAVNAIRSNPAGERITVKGQNGKG